jgi:aminoglycoside 6'-N-acetyltransferase/ribosomal-protein-alanine N-acetyltransferase
VIGAIAPITPEELEAISGWAYEPPYDLYDGRHEPVRNPERFHAAHDPDGVVVGFYYFELKGNVLEYGLGLRPDLTGRGLGLEFFKAGLEYGRERFRPERIVLAVATFNERAIKVYERAGFVRTGRHVRNLTNFGFGEVEFFDMEERC